MKKGYLVKAVFITVALICSMYGMVALAAGRSYYFEDEGSITLEAGQSLRLDHPNRPSGSFMYHSYAFYTSDESVVSFEYVRDDNSAVSITGLKPGKADVTGDLDYAVYRQEETYSYDPISKRYVTGTRTVTDKYQYRYRWVVTVNGRVEVSAPTARTLTYTGTEQILVNAGSAVGGTMQYAFGESPYRVPTSGWSTSVPSGKRATVYYVWYRVIGDEYYNDTDPACESVIISPADVTVTADAKSKSYGDADPTLTYSVRGLVGSDKLTGNITRAAGENAGTYAITQGALAAPDNYKIVFNGANLTINKRAVVVTASDQTVQQSGSIDTSVGQASLSGQLNGHVLSSVTLTADSTAQATIDGVITPSDARISDSGNADVTANYAISYVAGKLTVIASSTQTPTQPTTRPTQAPTEAPTIEPTLAPTKDPSDNKIKISKCTITVKDQYYTGKPLRPEVTVKYGKKVLKEGVDYAVAYKDNKEVGTATVTVSGMGNYTGKAKVTFEIRKKKKISECKFSVKNQVYTGKELKPNVTVKKGSTNLKKGTDYTLSYKNNKAVGVASVTVKGKGAYTGSKTLTFKINPKGTAFSKMKGGEKKITLNWKNPKNIKGYEVEYSLESDYYGSTRVKINNAKTLTTTIKGLKANKKYNVRIRTFAVVQKKTYYSAWSKSKTVKTKGIAANGNVDIDEMDFETPMQLDKNPVVTDDGPDLGIIAEDVFELPGA